MLSGCCLLQSWFKPLGYLLAKGAEEEPDIDGALQLLEEAADLGHPEAQYFTGRLLLEKGDRNGAKRYLEMASAQGDSRAEELLETL